MNSAHPRIQFEIDKPNASLDGQSLPLSLLDFMVTIKPDGDTEFEFNKKKAKKPVFLNYIGLLYLIKPSEVSSAMRHDASMIDALANPTTKEKHEKAFMQVLSLNDYPNNFTNNIILDNTSSHHHEPPPNYDTDWLYLGSR